MDNDKFKKILVTIDGSSHSMKAADFGIDIAQKYNANLLALHVLYSEIGFAFHAETAAGVVTPSSITELVEESKKEAETWFMEIKDKCKSLNVKFKSESIITAISIVEAIVSYSEAENVDLIIVGSRGRSGFKKLILGSIASGLVTYAHHPILIIK